MILERRAPRASLYCGHREENMPSSIPSANHAQVYFEASSFAAERACRASSLSERSWPVGAE